MTDTFSLLISKSNSDEELKSIITNILESDILNIEKYITNDKIQSIKNKYQKEYSTLSLFSRGDYNDYKKDTQNYITLSETMLFKLKKLTILKIASTNKSLNFTNLITVLDLKSQFELDNLLFELNISEWVVGKIDHDNQLFKVVEVKARDYIDNWSDVEAKIAKWLERVEKADRLLIGQVDSMRGYSFQCGCGMNKGNKS